MVKTWILISKRWIHETPTHNSSVAISNPSNCNASLPPMILGNIKINGPILVLLQA
jgi:hypothetical protein